MTNFRNLLESSNRRVALTVKSIFTLKWNDYVAFGISLCTVELFLKLGSFTLEFGVLAFLFIVLREFLKKINDLLNG